MKGDLVIKARRFIRNLPGMEAKAKKTRERASVTAQLSRGGAESSVTFFITHYLRVICI